MQRQQINTVYICIYMQVTCVYINMIIYDVFRRVLQNEYRIINNIGDQMLMFSLKNYLNFETSISLPKVISRLFLSNMTADSI